MDHANTPTIAGDHAARSVVRCSRVLNYDLARWVTELRPDLQAKHHSLLLEMDDAPLPPVLCDRQQLRQVVVNLVTHAHTGTENGGRITLSVRSADGQLRIAVQGAGGRALAHRALEPFTQRIVEAHGGSLEVEGQDGHGTTFAFTIPVHRESPRQSRRSAA